MSYSSLLKHRVDIYRISVEDANGIPVTSWTKTLVSIPAFVDLNFIRRGKDPVWTQEAGRPQDRSGVLFLPEYTDIRSGDRIIVTRGPKGSFQVEGAVDEAWRPENQHHMEIGCRGVQATDSWMGGSGRWL